MPARAIDSPTFEVVPYRLRLLQPLHTSRGAIELRDGFIVLARDGALTGRGEAAPLPGFGTETLEECRFELMRASFDRLPQTPAARHAAQRAMHISTFARAAVLNLSNARRIAIAATASTTPRYIATRKNSWNGRAATRYRASSSISKKRATT